MASYSWTAHVIVKTLKFSNIYYSLQD